MLKFFEWNIRISDWIESRLPHSFNFSLLERHRRRVVELCNRRPDQTLLDVGGGRACTYVRYFSPDRTVTIVALDIDEDELQANEHTNLLAVADATIALPIRSEAIDIVITSSVLEHLKAVQPFLAETYRVLRPGGFMVNVFPCRYAPFSILNRVIPEKLARSLLYYFYPQWKETCGFKAYYDKCYYSAMTKAMTDAGFVVSDVTIRYYQSIYYKFFVPFYLVMLCYDALISMVGIKNLCCQIMLVAEKK